MFDDSGYGSDRYVYVDGTRHLSGFVRTLRPVGAETGAQFEERMDVLARRLSAMQDVRSFTVEIVRRGGAAVECVVDVVLKVPAPAPIPSDGGQSGPTGARVSPRGSRGGQKHGRLALGLNGI